MGKDKAHGTGGTGPARRRRRPRGQSCEGWRSRAGERRRGRRAAGTAPAGPRSRATLHAPAGLAAPPPALTRRARKPRRRAGSARPHAAAAAAAAQRATPPRGSRTPSVPRPSNPPPAAGCAGRPQLSRFPCAPVPPRLTLSQQAPSS